jgi:hypothetical protein
MVAGVTAVAADQFPWLWALFWSGHHKALHKPCWLLGVYDALLGVYDAKLIRSIAGIFCTLDCTLAVFDMPAFTGAAVCKGRTSSSPVWQKHKRQ